MYNINKNCFYSSKICRNVKINPSITRSFTNQKATQKQEKGSKRKNNT